MIIVDYSHLAMRNLFVSIPKKPTFKTEEYIDIFFSQMLTSLRKIEGYKHKYGDIVLAIDSRRNWRKDATKNYKGFRAKVRSESPIDFDEYFEKSDELITILENGFGIKTIKVDNVEADDIGYVLSHLTDERTLLITEDKDWVQNLIGNLSVDILHPIKDKLIVNNQALQIELRNKRLIHCAIGDKVDAIPSILDNLEYTDDFKKFIEISGFNVSLPRVFEKNECFDGLLKQFNSKYADEPKIKVYKPGRFGEKTAEKIYNDLEQRKKFKKKHKANHKRILENFKLNRKLIDMSKIPQDLKQNIIDEFVNYKNSKDVNIINEFIDRYGLHNIRRTLVLNEVDLGLETSNAFSSFSDFEYDFSKPQEVKEEVKDDDFGEWGF